MEALLEHLERVIEQTRSTVPAELGDGRIIAASDQQIMRAMTLAAEVQRLTEAVLVETVGEVARRSGQRDRDLRLTSRTGCRDVGGCSAHGRRGARCRSTRRGTRRRAARVRRPPAHPGVGRSPCATAGA